MFRFAFALALSLLAQAASGQDLPKTITIIVPFAPGASSDAMGRLLAAELGARTRANVIVENKPGAGGAIGVSAVTRAAPDGSTFGLSAPSVLVVAPFVPKPSTPELLPSLAPVAKVADVALVLVANAQSGIKTVKDLVEKSKANPRGLSYGSPGAYSLQRLAADALAKATGAKLVHIVYRGSAPAVTDLLAGNIPLASVDLTSALPHIKAGTLIAIGLTSPTRSQIAPDIPLLSEVVPQYQPVSAWFGFFGPRGTPSPIVTRMSNELQAVLATPSIKDKLLTVALDPSYQDTEAFAQFLAKETARWKEAVKELPAQQ
jgi:tripartite-type tricarboxylate transporter receptor subunit TctC